MTHRYKNSPQDQQAAQQGKVENDTNKMGEQKPTQKNEGHRTPQSRGDRDDQLGNNQSQVRRGAPNSGEARQKR
jgi:hypothetical protein